MWNAYSCACRCERGVRCVCVGCHCNKMAGSCWNSAQLQKDLLQPAFTSINFTLVPEFLQITSSSIFVSEKVFDLWNCIKSRITWYENAKKTKGNKWSTHKIIWTCAQLIKSEMVAVFNCHCSDLVVNRRRERKTKIRKKRNKVVQHSGNYRKIREGSSGNTKFSDKHYCRRAKIGSRAAIRGRFRKRVVFYKGCVAGKIKINLL